MIRESSLPAPGSRMTRAPMMSSSGDAIRRTGADGSTSGAVEVTTGVPMASASADGAPSSGPGVADAPPVPPGSAGAWAIPIAARRLASAAAALSSAIEPASPAPAGRSSGRVRKVGAAAATEGSIGAAGASPAGAPPAADVAGTGRGATNRSRRSSSSAASATDVSHGGGWLQAPCWTCRAGKSGITRSAAAAAMKPTEPGANEGVVTRAASRAAHARKIGQPANPGERQNCSWWPRTIADGGLSA